MTTRKIEKISAMDVQDGDVIFKMGYRCRASRCITTREDGREVRNYVLTSEPDALNPDTLPGGYNGGVYGGSRLATEGREVVPHNANG